MDAEKGAETHDVLGVPVVDDVAGPSVDLTDVAAPTSGDQFDDSGVPLAFGPGDLPAPAGTDPFVQADPHAPVEALGDPGGLDAGVVVDPTAGLDPSNDHVDGLLDPSGNALLEGPITDTNLDGIDDHIQQHGA